MASSGCSSGGDDYGATHDERVSQKERQRLKERKRRQEIVASMDRLQAALPHLNRAMPTKSALLTFTIAYIQELEGEVADLRCKLKMPPRSTASSASGAKEFKDTGTNDPVAGELARENGLLRASLSALQHQFALAQQQQAHVHAQQAQMMMGFTVPGMGGHRLPAAQMMYGGAPPGAHSVDQLQHLLVMTMAAHAQQSQQAAMASGAAFSAPGATGALKDGSFATGPLPLSVPLVSSAGDGGVPGPALGDLGPLAPLYPGTTSASAHVANASMPDQSDASAAAAAFLETASSDLSVPVFNAPRVKRAADGDEPDGQPAVKRARA